MRLSVCRRALCEPPRAASAVKALAICSPARGDGKLMIIAGSTAPAPAALALGSMPYGHRNKKLATPAKASPEAARMHCCRHVAPTADLRVGASQAVPCQA